MVASKLSTVEFVDEAGRKSAFYGGAKAGGYWAAQSLPNGDGAGLILLIGEGVATVLSTREATGDLVIAALSCGNLLAVGREMHKRFPAAKLGILADLGNAKDKAEEAARATSSVLVLPDFGPNPPDGLADFNDLHQHRGREAVAECIRRQIAASSAQNGAPPGSEGAPERDSQDKDGPREARYGQGEAPGSAKASNGGQTRPDTGAAPADAEVIETAIAKLSTDIGAVFEPVVISALKVVRESKPADYQRYRKRIKDAGASVVELDRLVCVPGEKGDYAQGAPVLFPDIEPCPEPVDGAKLLTDLAAMFKRYAILPDHADVALALWVIFTHCIDAVSVASILALMSPEKRCGKSTVLAMIGRLVPRSLPAANISGSALFRAVEAWSPTLLIDEADSFLRNSEELRGILNSGHTRGLAFVIRTVGDDHEPRCFKTWGAKAIALIGSLKDTLADRSIEVALKRKLPGEHVEKLRHANPEALHNLARRCIRWAMDHAEEIRAARPSTPAGLHDRAQDNWEPLLAIADLAGGPWPEQTRAAALELSGAVDAGGLGIELLGDTRVVFEDRSVDRISSEDLVLALVGLEERRWSEYSHGKPITKAKLARLLRPYDVVSRSIRLPDGRTPKGYLLEQFTDAFNCYLPPEDPPFKAQHRHNVDGARVSEDFESATADGCVVSENGPEPSCGAGCGGVADSKPPPWGARI